MKLQREGSTLISTCDLYYLINGSANWGAGAMAHHQAICCNAFTNSASSGCHPHHIIPGIACRTRPILLRKLRGVGCFAGQFFPELLRFDFQFAEGLVVLVADILGVFCLFPLLLEDFLLFPAVLQSRPVLLLLLIQIALLLLQLLP